MTDGTDEEGPEPARLDPLVVTDQVEEAVLDCFIPGVVTELGELLEHGVLVVPVPGHRVGGDGLEIYRQLSKTMTIYDYYVAYPEAKF